MTSGAAEDPAGAAASLAHAARRLQQRIGPDALPPQDVWATLAHLATAGHELERTLQRIAAQPEPSDGPDARPHLLAAALLTHRLALELDAARTVLQDRAAAAVLPRGFRRRRASER